MAQKKKVLLHLMISEINRKSSAKAPGVSIPEINRKRSAQASGIFIPEINRKKGTAFGLQ
jgi:hypothetical protein